MNPKNLIQEVIDSESKLDRSDKEAAAGEVAESVYKSFQDKFFAKMDRRDVSASQAGSCARKLAYNYHGFEGEPLTLRSRFAMFMGDVMESVVVTLLKMHPENDQYGFQREVEFNGIKGHIDFEDDEYVTDAKCLADSGFKKETGKEGISDTFGYATQGTLYALATGKKFRHLAINKNNGDMEVIDAPTLPDWKLAEMARWRKEAVEASTPENLPEREQALEYDKRKDKHHLGIVCVYCPFKYHCWDIREEEQVTPAYRRYYAVGPK